MKPNYAWCRLQGVDGDFYDVPFPNVVVKIGQVLSSLEDQHRP